MGIQNYLKYPEIIRQAYRYCMMAVRVLGSRRGCVRVSIIGSLRVGGFILLGPTPPLCSQRVRVTPCWPLIPHSRKNKSKRSQNTHERGVPRPRKTCLSVCLPVPSQGIGGGYLYPLLATSIGDERAAVKGRLTYIPTIGAQGSKLSSIASGIGD